MNPFLNVNNNHQSNYNQIINNSLCNQNLDTCFNKEINVKNAFPAEKNKLKLTISPVNLYRENYCYVSNDNDILKTSSSLNPSLNEKKIYYHRNSVILSSNKDKDTLDGETVFTPQRSIDRIEKMIANKTLVQTDLSTASPPINLDIPSNDLPNNFSNDLPNNISNYSPEDLSNEQVDFTSHKKNLSSEINNNIILDYFNTQKMMPYFKNNRFINPFNTWKDQSILEIIKFFLKPSNLSLPRNKKDLNLYLPVIKPMINKEVNEDELRVSWIGHSTVLVQFENFTLITDPIFSNHAYPCKLGFYKRYRPTPISINELPSNLRAVLISHNHYDHLDRQSVKQLNKKYLNLLTWFVPKGLISWFKNLNIENVIELNWWKEYSLSENEDIKFVFLPTQHWSRRTLLDKNKSLWGSWAVLNKNLRFYFAGDTGYNKDLFKLIGQEYGPFDLAAIPIGAYEPNRFLKYQHVNPKEAVQIHNDINSKLSMAIHWGTFPLSKEHFLNPPKRLHEALDNLNISKDKFVIFEHGETRLVKSDGTSKKENINRYGKI